MIDLKGKLAVVTGGNRGIGLAIARALHVEGCRVVITGRDVERLQKSAKEVGERCWPCRCDHAHPDSIEAATREILERLGTVDILVNNAGIYRNVPVLEMDLRVWNEMIATNLTGVFLTTRALLAPMIDQRRGDIIMISSMSGKKGDPGAAGYAASKFGLQGFAQALLYEVRRHGIRVMVLNPSEVEKDDLDRAEHGPGLYLHARDLAATVVHLCKLPGRTLIRDLDVWGTNPYR